MKVESLVRLVLGLGELTAVDGVQDGTRVLERATLATSGSAGTDPAGVEQPGVDLVILDLFREHLSVAHGVESKEGLGEAGGEGGLGLRDSVFGTGHLRGVTTDEVEHGLLGSELGDGRKDTTGIAGEEDDVGRVAITDTGNESVLDVLDGVGTEITISERNLETHQKCETYHRVFSVNVELL